MRIQAVMVALAALTFLAACGGGRPINAVGPAVTISLSAFPLPEPVTITPAFVETITADVIDQDSQGVIWSIAPLNFGTLSTQTSTHQPSTFRTTASVLYTAPVNVAAPATVTVTATSISNPTVSVSLPIKVNPIFVSLQVTVLATGNTTLAVDQTLNQGEQLGLIGTATSVLGKNPGVAWSISPASGAGSLTGQTISNATYVAPSTVSSSVTATVTATSIASPSATASLQVTVLPSGAGTNVTAVKVNGGPVPTQSYPNGAFTSVTICNPGSTNGCQTIEGILVDTGSNGLRILQSQIPLLKLPTFTDGNGNVLQNCSSNVDGSYLWGTVSQADVYISGEMGSTVPIQVISASNAVVPDGCSNGGTTNLNTPQLLGANGILGVGPEPTDCTLAGVNFCDGSTQSAVPSLYYGCPITGCLNTDTPVIVAAGTFGQQVANPVTFFSFNPFTFNIDNNGVVLQIPSVSGVESTVTGTLTFGVGTETNNGLGNATVFTLDSNDNFTTIFRGQTLTDSFIDSGSNGLFFPYTLPTCPISKQYFCPSSPTNLSAENKGATEGDSMVNFSVDNADRLFSTYPGDAVFDSLAGPEGTYQSCSDGNTSCIFDWGLPFFYGRTVYTHIDACQPPPAACSPLTGAYFAY